MRSYGAFPSWLSTFSAPASAKDHIDEKGIVVKVVDADVYCVTAQPLWCTYDAGSEGDYLGTIDAVSGATRINKQV